MNGKVYDLFDEPLMEADEDAEGKKKEEENVDHPVRDSEVAGKIRTGVSVVNKSVNDPLDRANDVLDKQKVNNSSIIARSRNSVCQFPIYVTQSLPVNAAHTISKMFERLYVTLVQSVLSQSPILDAKDADELRFLKKYHTNIKESVEAYKDLIFNEYYTPIDETDQLLQESVMYSESVSDDVIMDFRLIPTTDKNLISENARLMHEPLSGLRYLREAEKPEAKKADAENKITEENNKRVYLNEGDLNDMAKNRGQSVGDLKKDIRDGAIKNYGYDGSRYYHLEKSTKITTGMPSAKKDDEPKVVQVNTRGVDPPVLLHDSDIKKANGMLPQTMEVSFRLRDKNGNIVPGDMHYIIGVKSVLHLVHTKDLVEDLRDLVSGNIKSLRKVRYKSGEISFMDYLFDVKQLKKDASKNIHSDKRWVATLKNLANYERMNGSIWNKPAKLLAGGNVPIPNATLILTQTDVTALTNQTGIDLSKVKNAKRLINNLFLIALCIVDASAGSMKVLYQGENEWDVQSLASIDSEVSKMDNSALLRELNKAVNK